MTIVFKVSASRDPRWDMLERLFTLLDLSAKSVPLVCTFAGQHVLPAKDWFHPWLCSSTCIYFACFSPWVQNFMPPQVPFQCVVWMSLKVKHIARKALARFLLRQLSILNLISIQSLPATENT
jgi:hypothetical protein